MRCKSLLFVPRLEMQNVPVFSYTLTLRGQAELLRFLQYGEQRTLPQ